MAESSALRLYAHIPGVALDGITELPLSSGRLATIAFDAWRELDDWVAGDNPRKFEANRPVFYVCDLDPLGDPFSDVHATVHPIVNRVFSTLILSTVAALPEPFLSMAYVHNPASSAVQRLVGPTGRNLVLGDLPRSVVLTSNETSDVQEMFEFVGRTAHVLADPHVAQAMAALRRAALPEYRAIDNIVHGTLALEGLVSSARPSSGSTAAFIRRSVALVARNREEIEPATTILELVYDLRSRALHGQDPASADDDLAGTGNLMRSLVIRAVTHTLAFIDDERDVRAGLAALRRLLDRAVRDEPAWNELRARANPQH